MSLAVAAALRARLPDVASTDALVAALEAAIARARIAWPAATPELETFAAYLGERLAPSATLDAAVAAVCVEDLWLACAIASGQAAAIAAYDAACRADLPRALAHLDGGTALVDDVHQAVRDQVLPASVGGAGGIVGYRGRGRLRAWTRVIAVRAALALVGRRRELPLDDALAPHVGDGPVDGDVGLAPHYRAAFAAGLAELSPRERNLLRQQHLHGVGLDELAGLYGVHRATIARWLARSRARVARATRRHLGLALGLTGVELDRAVAELGRDLDYSLRHTLSREG